MATAKQIQFRLKLAKKNLARLNKENTAAKKKIRTLEADLKKAKAAEKAAKAKAKAKKKAGGKKKAATKRKTTSRKKPAAGKKATAKKK